VRYQELPGVGHQELTASHGDAFSATAQYLEEAFS
jgi:hypothetical protein